MHTNEPGETSAEVVDASSFYRLWEALLAFNLAMALSTADGSNAEKAAARERFFRAQEIYLQEREAAWNRIIVRMKAVTDDRRLDP